MGKVNNVATVPGHVQSQLATRSRDVWATLPGSFAPFFPEQMKDDIAESGAVFTVLGCNLREKTAFGPCWMVDIEFGGQLFTIPFSAADFRDDTMNGVRDALRSGGPFEATLRTFDTERGHGWALAAPDYGDGQEQNGM